MEKNNLHSVIDLLNENGVNLIVIEDRIYSFIEFTPSDEDAYYSTLVGKDITELIENRTAQMGFNRNEMIHLTQKIDQMSNRRKEFHQDIRWRKFLSGR